MRGRTLTCSLVARQHRISIHSLVRGRTQQYVSDVLSISHFNPLPRERENEFGKTNFRASKISIHSLVRGRTALSAFFTFSSVFQSTPSWEGERKSWTCPKSGVWFQSTPSWEGERLLALPSLQPQKNFNPLPRERENRNIKLIEHFTIPFQSTPSWEGEPHSIAQGDWACDFNPLPRERENANPTNLAVKCVIISIHSLVRGRTGSDYFEP